MTFQRFPAAALLLVASGTLYGCTDPKEPSAEAFRPALEAQVRDRFCSVIDVMPYEVEGQGGDAPFPIVTSPRRGMAGPGSDGMSVAMLDAFAQTGLATRTAFEKPARWKGASDKPFVSPSCPTRRRRRVRHIYAPSSIRRPGRRSRYRRSAWRRANWSTSSAGPSRSAFRDARFRAYRPDAGRIERPIGSSELGA